MELGLLVLRVLVGGLLAAHGAQKLFGLFGGHGMAGTAELTGGVLLALGLVTPLGAALLTAVMVAAILTVHLRNGVWNTADGYEYNVVLIAAAFALAAVGAGEWSLDNALGLDVAGTGWALAALGAGLLGGLGAVVSGRTASARDAGAQPAA